jgi:hypothetical protein
MMAGNGIGNIWHELVQPALGFKSMAPGVARRNPLISYAKFAYPPADHLRAIASSLAKLIGRQVYE